MRPRHYLRRALPLAALAFSLAVPALFAGNNANSYLRRDLVSDGGVPAEQIDPFLINGWGLAASPSGTWWVNAADSGKSLLYNGDGIQSYLVVNVPGEPTGIVFNGGDGFALRGVGPARFLFASEDGTISAWSPDLSPDTDAVVVIDNSGSAASYKGLAIDSTGKGRRIFAADFHNAKVDVFDSAFQPIAIRDQFFDPGLPPGYAPFGIQTLAGSVFVAYALQDETGYEEVVGRGLGVVDKYDFDGRLLSRVATGGALNAPWGMALAPAGFDRFSGQLLVGNFGDGRINAFDPATFAPVGYLKGADHQAIEIDGLWGIGFGNGMNAGPATTLFFAAGPEDAAHGLFGRLDPSRIVH